MSLNLFLHICLTRCNSRTDRCQSGDTCPWHGNEKRGLPGGGGDRKLSLTVDVVQQHSFEDVQLILLLHVNEFLLTFNEDRLVLLLNVATISCNPYISWNKGDSPNVDVDQVDLLSQKFKEYPTPSYECYFFSPLLHSNRSSFFPFSFVVSKTCQHIRAKIVSEYWDQIPSSFLRL